MDLRNYIEKFSDVIPFTFKLTVWPQGNPKIERNRDFINYKNHKGKVLTTSQSSVLGPINSYTPLEKINMPIIVEINYPYPHFVKWEKTQATTNKQISSFTARILTTDLQRQFGFMILEVTPAGDIHHKYCSYYNNDGTHNITQSVNYEYDNKTKSVKRYERIDYVSINPYLGIEETVSLYKEDGVLTGLTTSKQPLRNHAYDSVVWSEENVNEQNELFSRFSSKKEVERATVLNCDMVNYIINKDFTSRKEEIKQVESALASRIYDQFGCDRLNARLQKLKKPEYDVYSSFYGTYVGNTVIKKENSTYLFVETENDGYRYFSFVDITGTNAFDIDFEHVRSESPAYYNAMVAASKTPVFRLQLIDGSYSLVPLGEQLTEEETYYYGLFSSLCSNDLAALENDGFGTISFTKKTNAGDGTSRKLTPKGKKSKKKKKQDD